MPGWPSLVVVRSSGGALLGDVFHLGKSPAYIGRNEECAVHLPDATVSRRHVLLTREGEHWQLQDLHSSSGTYLNGTRSSGPTPLLDGDLIELGPITLRVFLGHRAAQRAHFEAERFRDLDLLTSTLSRDAILAHLTRAIARAQPRGEPLSVLLCNIDHLRAFNDLHGLSAGDDAIASVARWLQGAATPQERLGRIRGDVFLMTAAGAELPAAISRAEVLRELVAARTLQVPDGIARLTISVGVAALRQGDPGPEALLERAEEALYFAQRSGRNCSRSELDSTG